MANNVTTTVRRDEERERERAEKNYIIHPHDGIRAARPNEKEINGSRRTVAYA